LDFVKPSKAPLAPNWEGGDGTPKGKNHLEKGNPILTTPRGTNPTRNNPIPKKAPKLKIMGVKL